MNPSFASIERWYRQRPPREQAMVLAGAVIAPLLILYLAVWEPLAAARVQLSKEVPLLREATARFLMQADEVERLRGRTASRNPNRSVRSAVEESAARMGITLQGIESTGSDHTLVQISTVSFDALSRWLGDLATAEGLVVENIQMAAASDGQVKVERLMLAPATRRPPAEHRS